MRKGILFGDKQSRERVMPTGQQCTLNVFLGKRSPTTSSEDLDYGSSSDEEESDYGDDGAKKKKKKFEEGRWSRIVKPDDNAAGHGREHSLQVDKQVLDTLSAPAPIRRSRVWAPIFCPDSYKKLLANVAIDEYVLAEKKLRDLAIQIIKYRKR